MPLPLQHAVCDAPRATRDASTLRRLRTVIGGAVQGVGFRPFVYRLARELGLPGTVRNDLRGVEVEVEGLPEILRQFLVRLSDEAPAGSRIESCESVWLDAAGISDFRILESEIGATTEVWIRPDSATCRECLEEIFDPADRRWRYPFTNCTHCGPRYTLMERLPYDRPNTSMKGFSMCTACAREYGDPGDRRFHAQPNACPVCGPQLALWDESGGCLAERDAAIVGAVSAIRSGRIVAVKGLGGFHLLTRADDAEAVSRLRQRKRRSEKPLAVMFPSLEEVRICCECSGAEARLLQSPEAPIVLLDRLGDGDRFSCWRGDVAQNVAPGQATLGVFLPYTPLHHLLLRDLGLVVVATSGNRSDEPICTDEREALARLAGIADFFLVHDRPIVRPVDDSVVRVVAGREMVLRRARGFAPLPVRVTGDDGSKKPVVLGVGAHLKNSVALGRGREVFVSQHVGDLNTVEAYEAFRRVITDLQTLYDVRVQMVAADGHPDYLSTRYARECGYPVETVQHHLAHVAAVVAENEIEGPVLGVSWDGTGLGEDRTLWGGEFLWVHRADWRRVAHLRAFPLPGGDWAVREPRRSALGLVLTWFPEDWAESDLCLRTREAFSPTELRVLSRVVRSGTNTPMTTSMGRLFDAAASLLGVRQRCAFEGQAAMELEAIADQARASAAAYPLVLGTSAASPGAIEVDWEPWMDGMMRDRLAGVPVDVLAARFHASLVEAVVGVARRIGQEAVALGGGCFQNRRLLQGCVERLTAEGHRVYWAQRVPPNDGGLALGQVSVARWRHGSTDCLFRNAT